MLTVFLSQPAGIESFFPLYDKLPLTFITTSPVVHNLLQKQYKLSHLYFDTLEQCLDYIQKERSKILLTDASLSSHLSAVIKHAKSLNILTISILDFWGRYKDRFREEPDLIIVPNEHIYKELLREGFKQNKLLKLGNPFFEWILQQKPIYRKEYGNFLDASKKNILFISQSFKEDGYEQTQEEIFQKWLQNNQSEGINIMVKPHPRENPNWMCNYNVKIVNLTSDDSIYNFIYFCDLVVGVNSTVLYVCFLRKIPFQTIDNNFFINFNNPDILPYPNSIVNLTNFLRLFL